MRPIELSEQAIRARAKWTFVAVIAVTAILGGWLHAHAQPEPPLDWRAAPNALNAALVASDAPSGEATFTWTFEAPGQVACSLDADGDAELDYRSTDCRGQNRVTFRFDERDQGVFFATLLARSDDGRTGIARAQVDVR